MKNRIVAAVLIATLALSSCGKKANNDGAVNAPSATEDSQVTSPGDTQIDVSYIYEAYAGMTPEEIVDQLTLEQKAYQMVMPAIYNTNTDEMNVCDFGAILSKSQPLTYDKWQETVDDFQMAAISSDSGVPFIYGQDDVHGVNYCSGAVIFPQNIGMGAANDPELMYQVGLATADEALLCHMIWNYAPCLAQSVDPRWGRTYESYGSDLDIITDLGTGYTKGLIDGGVIACAKHYFADGNVLYGTGEESGGTARLIDRGDAILSDKEIEELLEVYQAEIDSGVQTIMISHSALNGLKMHENEEYIMKLKDEMGFEGFIASDWESIQFTSGESYEDQVVTAINSGIDMLMEVNYYDEAAQIIVEAVEDGRITQDRVDDAVRRIIKVKQEAGVIEDPFFINVKTKQSATGSDEYRALAEKAVEESLVLIKNDNDVLPIASGKKIYIMGPAADDAAVQCGGWTLDRQGPNTSEVPGATTIKEGFEEVCEEQGIEIVSDMSDADEIILVVGEETYAEWPGDTEDLQLCGSLGLEGNEGAIKKAKESGKPVVALIVAGRNVIISDYANDWDGIVMCYLPGSEGQGVANVVCGKADFKGSLPSPWYSSVDQIGTEDCWLRQGYSYEN